MKNYTSYSSCSILFTAALLAVPALSSASVASLDFNGGVGTSLVDQYQGIAGSGWATAWNAWTASAVSSSTTTVEDTSPLYAGGGNYLHMRYSTGVAGDNGSTAARVSRGLDMSALSLADPFTISFYFRSDVNVANASQSFVLFGANNATNFTGSDSWRLQANGAGWSVFDKNQNNGNGAMVTLSSGTILANEVWRFDITVLAANASYSISAYREGSPDVVYSLTDLGLRYSAAENLSYLNFVANGGASVENLGFAIDGITVANIPESGTSSLILGAGVIAVLGAMRLRRRR